MRCRATFARGTVLEDALGPGAAGDFDEVATWTGCVAREDGRWWLVLHGPGALTGCNGSGWRRPTTSTDGRSAALLVEADPVVYEREHWRDPWVLEVDGRAAHAAVRPRGARPGGDARRDRARRARRRRGAGWRPGRCPSRVTTSSSRCPRSSTWAAPGGCLFCTEHGEQWGTHYLTGPSPLGPFTLDRPDFLAGDAAGSHYAGRVLEHGGRRHFFAWRQHDARGAFLGELSDPMELLDGPPPSVTLP